MKLPGQCEIKVNGKSYHFYFGIDATAEFLHLYRRSVTFKGEDGKDITEIRDLSLAEFATPFLDNETRALINMFYCGLLAGDTKNELPEDLTHENFGRWLDQADKGSFASLVVAYHTSKPLGK